MERSDNHLTPRYHCIAYLETMKSAEIPLSNRECEDGGSWSSRIELSQPLELAPTVALELPRSSSPKTFYYDGVRVWHIVLSHNVIQCRAIYLLLDCPFVTTATSGDTVRDTYGLRS